ncbi:MAG: 50S ribosomal protein L22 [Candidatus Omnitrophota bacterium]
MISKAKAKFIRVSPQRTRQIIDLVRGKNVVQALNILNNLNKGARKSVIKVLQSAISNSKQFDVDEKNLYISKIIADNGPMLKRHRAASFGRAVEIKHRLCHILIELDELKKSESLKVRDKKMVNKSRVKSAKPKQRKNEE